MFWHHVSFSWKNSMMKQKRKEVQEEEKKSMDELRLQHVIILHLLFLQFLLHVLSSYFMLSRAVTKTSSDITSLDKRMSQENEQRTSWLRKSTPRVCCREQEKRISCYLSLSLSLSLSLGQRMKRRLFYERNASPTPTTKMKINHLDFDFVLHLLLRVSDCSSGYFSSLHLLRETFISKDSSPILFQFSSKKIPWRRSNLKSILFVNQVLLFSSSLLDSCSSAFSTNLRGVKLREKKKKEAHKRFQSKESRKKENVN